jgi:hypothetical protein
MLVARLCDAPIRDNRPQIYFVVWLGNLKLNVCPIQWMDLVVKSEIRQQLKLFHKVGPQIVIRRLDQRCDGNVRPPSKGQNVSHGQGIGSIVSFSCDKQKGSSTRNNPQVTMSGIGDSSRHTPRHFQINVPGLITQQDGKVGFAFAFVFAVVLTEWVTTLSPTYLVAALGSCVCG